MSEELKPCPFCGSKMITLGYLGQPAVGFHLVCVDCKAQGPTIAPASPTGAMPLDVSSSWNRRASRPEAESEMPLAATIDEFRYLESNPLYEALKLALGNLALHDHKEAERIGAMARAASAPVAGNAARDDARIADALNTLLWLYRRLPSAYGNPPFVDKAIMDFADVLGLDAPEAIKERLTLHRNARPERQIDTAFFVQEFDAAIKASKQGGE